jgi:hypothetical protein
VVKISFATMPVRQHTHFSDAFHRYRGGIGR